MRKALALLAVALTLPFVDAGAASVKPSTKAPHSGDAFASALALSRGGSPDAAVAAWSRLAREKPRSPEIRNNLAVSLTRAGRRAEARRTLLAATKLQPKYASIQRNLDTDEEHWLLIDTLPGRDGTRTVAMTRSEAEALLGPADPPLAPERPAPAVVDGAQAALAAWAKAWQARDVDAYLAAYHPDFTVPHGADRGTWEAERRKRILGKPWIKVGISDAQWSSPDGPATAVVRYTQDYEAPSLRERSRKQITWRQTEQGWRIAEERTLAR